MKPRPSHYSGAILKKLEHSAFFAFNWDAARKKNESWVEAVAFGERAVGSGNGLYCSGNGLWGLGHGLWLANCRPPHKGHLRSVHKGTVLMLRTVQFMNGLRPSNKWPVCSPVCQLAYSSYCTNCHICALFVNGHRLATNGHVH